MLKKFFNKVSFGLVWPFKTLWRKWKRFYEKLSRSCRWAKRMWDNPDWDFSYLIEMIVYKLKDMRYQLDVKDRWFVDLRHQPVNIGDNDSSDYETIDHLEELDKAIEIGERLMECNYIKYTPDIQKWMDEHKMTDKMPEKLHKKLMKIYDDSDKQEEKDRKDFFNLIRDNHQKWWS